jgi:hypothetical protein
LPDKVYDAAIYKAKRHLVEIVSGLHYTGKRGSDLVVMAMGRLRRQTHQRRSAKDWRAHLDTLPRALQEDAPHAQGRHWQRQ